MPKRVTMSDVARETGVSLMTVSRVINNKGEISPETQHRVQEVIDQLGYRPSSIARSLATQQTLTIGLIVPDVANPFFAEVARGVEHLAYSEGYNVFLCNTEENPQRELAVLQSLEEKRVDGIILCSSRLKEEQLEEALAHQAASVLINRKLENHTTSIMVESVILDDQTGGKIATEHLLNGGHTAIGFLAGPEISFSGRGRHQGYKLALEATGIPYNTNWVRYCIPTVEGGYQAALTLFTNAPELSAVYCYNDLVAVGALKVCNQLGNRVPEDMAVVGCDDIQLAALVTPALTTCRVPRYELGGQAVRALLDRINECSSGYSEIVLQSELVVRASAP